MKPWVHASVQRRHMTCTQSCLQFRQRQAAGVTQNEIESAQTFRFNVRHFPGLAKAIQRHGRIEIIKDPHRNSRIERRIRCRNGVRTVGSDDRGIRVL